MDESPFGKLSPELRNEIYGYIFSEKRIVFFKTYGTQIQNFQHPLTLTCRQIRHETLILDLNRIHIMKRIGRAEYETPYILPVLQCIGAASICEIPQIGYLYCNRQHFAELSRGKEVRTFEGDSDVPNDQFDCEFRQSIRVGLLRIGLCLRAA